MTQLLDERVLVALGEVGRELQALDGHRLIEVDVVTAIHDAEAAFPDDLEHAELAGDHSTAQSERVALCFRHPSHGNAIGPGWRSSARFWWRRMQSEREQILGRDIAAQDGFRPLVDEPQA